MSSFQCRHRDSGGELLLLAFDNGPLAGFLYAAGWIMAGGAVGLGTENVVNRIYAPIIRAIERLGTLDRKQYVSFELHWEVDDAHHEALLKIAQDFSDVAQNRIALRKGILKALGLRNIF